MKKYDVVIIGGGTAGCAVAFMAGMSGLKVLLLEKNIHLGGAITSGLVVPVMNCGENQINREFYDALTTELKSLGGQVTYLGNQGWFNPELTKIALDNLMRKASVEVLFGVHIQDVAIDERKIFSVQISNEILSVYNGKLYDNNKKLSVSIGAKYYVDATGNCEIGKLCNCEFLEKNDEQQPVSLRFIMSGVDVKRFGEWLKDYDKDRNVTTVENIDGEVHLSTACTWDRDKKWALAPLFKEAEKNNILKPQDWNYFQVFTVAGMPTSVAFNCPRIIDYTDMNKPEEVSKALQDGRQSILRLADFCKRYFLGFEKAYISNIADILGVRVSRRIKGKYIYTADDIITSKKFKKPVVVSNYPIDVHSSKKDQSTLRVVKDYELPLESLMSADIDNLFVAGRCISTDFMSQGAIRVQASCFAMGVGLGKYFAELENNHNSLSLAE